MNDDACLYSKSNDIQRNVTKRTFVAYAPLLQWREDGLDTVLDIGCGVGNVTKDIVMPLLPATFRRLVGCDVSDKMIDYARQNCGHPKINYEQLDIGKDVGEFLNKFGTFDHIVSFFCLQWVSDQKAAVENIYRLLTPKGDSVLVILTSTIIYAVYNEMEQSSKWSTCIKEAHADGISFTSPYMECDTPDEDLCTLFRSVGFSSCNVRIQKESFTYTHYEDFKNFVEAVNPFVHRISSSDKNDFIAETAERIIRKNVELREEKLTISVNIAIVHAIM